jgi:hypothetical protein
MEGNQVTALGDTKNKKIDPGKLKRKISLKLLFPFTYTNRP